MNTVEVHGKLNNWHYSRRCAGRETKGEDDSNAATAVNYGVGPSLSLLMSICNPEWASRELEGPEDYSHPYKDEHLERVWTTLPAYIAQGGGELPLGP